MDDCVGVIHHQRDTKARGRSWCALLAVVLAALLPAAPIQAQSYLPPTQSAPDTQQRVDAILLKARREVAVDFAQASCNAQDAEGCSVLANYYRHGLGVKADPSKADKLMTQAWSIARGACTTQAPQKCRALGMLHTYHMHDSVQGLHYLTMACNASEADSCLQIGILYSYRNPAMKPPIPRDMDKAAPYFEKSCNLNLARGCVVMANRFMVDFFTVRDNGLLLQARSYYEKALALDPANERALSGIEHLDEIEKEQIGLAEASPPAKE